MSSGRYLRSASGRTQRGVHAAHPRRVPWKALRTETVCRSRGHDQGLGLVIRSAIVSQCVGWMVIGRTAHVRILREYRASEGRGHDGCGAESLDAECSDCHKGFSIDLVKPSRSVPTPHQPLQAEDVPAFKPSLQSATRHSTRREESVGKFGFACGGRCVVAMTSAFSSAVACNIWCDHYEEDIEEIFRNESGKRRSSNARLDRGADLFYREKKPRRRLFRERRGCCRRLGLRKRAPLRTAHFPV